MSNEWRLGSLEGITFRTPSFACASLVALLTTGGKSAAIQADTGITVPAFPTGGDSKWLVATFGKGWPDLMEENAAELASALRSLASPSEAGRGIVKTASRLAGAFD